MIAEFKLIERGRLGAIWPRRPRFAKVFRPSGTDACRKQLVYLWVSLVLYCSKRVTPGRFGWESKFSLFCVRCFCFLFFVCYPFHCSWSVRFLPKKVPKAPKLTSFRYLTAGGTFHDLAPNDWLKPANLLCGIWRAIHCHGLIVFISWDFCWTVRPSLCFKNERQIVFQQKKNSRCRFRFKSK